MKTSTLITTLILLSCASVLSSCIHTNPTESPDPKLGYFPLEVGNMWEYEATVPTFAEYHHTVRVVAQRNLGAVMEYDLVDSIFNATINTSIEKYSVRQRDALTFAADSSWLIDFNATATDGDERHGYVVSRSDTSTVVAGTFNDIVHIFYPASARDAMPFEDYAAGVGLIRRTAFRFPTELRRAIIHSQKIGKW